VGGGACSDISARDRRDPRDLAPLLRPGHAAQAFRRFVAAEPETALRVLLTPAGGVHERAVALQREVFVEAIERDGAELPRDLDDLAYLYVRIFESMLYVDILSDRDPSFEVAARARRALLTRS